VADGRERTRAEREAARLERERRRTGVFNQPVSERFGAEPGEPDSAAPEVPGASPPEEPHHALPAESYEADLGHDVDDDAAGDVGHHDDDLAELPSGTRRVSRLQQRPAQRRPRAVKRRPKPAGRRSKHSWAGRAVSLVLLILAGALAWFLIELFQPFGASPHGRVTVVIPSHAGASRIGDQLAREGIISSGFFFELRAALGGERGDLRSGTYHFQLGMSYGSVLTALTKAPPAAKTTQLTISEGHTRQYVGALLRKQRIKGNYVAATRSSKLLDPHTYGAAKHVPSLEGFLFPDTFTLLAPVKVSALVDDQLRDFKRRFAKVNLNYARRKHLSPYKVLTVASLIEAEAASAKARPLIASVIYNRLANGMMLQFDSTTRYATGNFTKPLRVSQLKSRSPYNTHTHFGLPPTPIDSPGLASIQAAAHPAQTRYLYFFAKPCSSSSVFATSYSQFLNLLQRDKRTHCP
jgi:UPF0755 protein